MLRYQGCLILDTDKKNGDGTRHCIVRVYVRTRVPVVDIAKVERLEPRERLRYTFA